MIGLISLVLVAMLSVLDVMPIKFALIAAECYIICGDLLTGLAIWFIYLC